MLRRAAIARCGSCCRIMISFHQHAWEDYLYWQQTDKSMLRRIVTAQEPAG
jgi:YoeB-like toxin of bacterial type II toxin-antitoxin system